MTKIHFVSVTLLNCINRLEFTISNGTNYSSDFFSVDCIRGNFQKLEAKYQRRPTSNTLQLALNFCQAFKLTVTLDATLLKGAYYYKNLIT